MTLQKLRLEDVKAIKKVMVPAMCEYREYTIEEYVNRVGKFTIDMLLTHMFAWEYSTCWGREVKKRTPKHTIDYFR